jgi:hypothetical protein
MNDPHARALFDSQKGVPAQARPEEGYGFSNTAVDLVTGNIGNVSTQRTDRGPALPPSPASPASPSSSAAARAERRPQQLDPRLLDGVTMSNGMDEDDERQFRRASPYNLR